MTLKQKEERITRIGFIFTVFITVIHLAPIIIMILNSMRPNAEIDKQMLGLPTSLDFSNYVYAWVKGDYLRSYFNSLFIGFFVALGIVLLDGFAAYGVVKLRCYFKSFFDSYFVAGLAIPRFAILVPLYFMFYKVHLVDNHWGLIILYIATNLSFNYMFMSAFFRGMPTDLDDAARIDGASETQNFWYVVMPLAFPVFSSTFLIAFVTSWNEYMFANLFLTSSELKTVSLQFFTFAGKFSMDYGYVYAAGIISILPIIIVYLFTQQSFIEGMTAGSLKG